MFGRQSARGVEKEKIEDSKIVSPSKVVFCRNVTLRTRKNDSRGHDLGQSIRRERRERKRGEGASAKSSPFRQSNRCRPRRRTEQSYSRGSVSTAGKGYLGEEVNDASGF